VHVLIYHHANPSFFKVPASSKPWVSKVRMHGWLTLCMVAYNMRNDKTRQAYFLSKPNADLA
jgi:hypothetical protein